VTGNGAARACGNACSPNTSDTINVANKTNPIQSARRLCVFMPVAKLSPISQATISITPWMPNVNVLPGARWVWNAASEPFSNDAAPRSR